MDMNEMKKELTARVEVLDTLAYEAKQVGDDDQAKVFKVKAKAYRAVLNDMFPESRRMILK